MSNQDPEQSERDRVQESILEILKQAANPVGRPDQRVTNRVVSFIAGSMFNQIVPGNPVKTATKAPKASQSDVHVDEIVKTYTLPFAASVMKATGVKTPKSMSMDEAAVRAFVKAGQDSGLTLKQIKHLLDHDESNTPTAGKGKQGLVFSLANMDQETKDLFSKMSGAFSSGGLESYFPAIEAEQSKTARKERAEAEHKAAQSPAAIQPWQPSAKMNSWFDRMAGWFGDKSVVPGTPTGRQRFSYDVMREDGNEERLTTTAASNKELTEFLQAIHDSGKGVVTRVQHDGSELGAARTSPLERMMNSFADMMGVPKTPAPQPASVGEDNVTEALDNLTGAIDRNTDAISGKSPTAPTAAPHTAPEIPPIQSTPGVQPVAPWTSPLDTEHHAPFPEAPSSGDTTNHSANVEQWRREEKQWQAERQSNAPLTGSGVPPIPPIDDSDSGIPSVKPPKSKRIPAIPPTWDKWFGDDVAPASGGSGIPPVKPPEDDSVIPATPANGAWPRGWRSWGSPAPAGGSPPRPPGGGIPPVTPPGGGGIPPVTPPGGIPSSPSGGGPVSPVVEFFASRLGVAASTVSRFGSAIGIAAPPLIAGYVAFRVMIAGITMVAKSLKKLADEAWITTQRLANYNGSLAYGAAMLDFNREMRKFHHASKVAEGGLFSGKDRFNAENRLEQALQPLKEQATVIGNDIGYLIVMELTGMVIILNKILEMGLRTSAFIIDSAAGDPFNVVFNATDLLSGPMKAKADAIGNPQGNMPVQPWQAMHDMFGPQGVDAQDLGNRNRGARAPLGPQP